jgi:hypothetical protein
MSNVESETNELEIENYIMVVKEILNEREYEKHERRDILLQYMTVIGIKPVSLVDLNNDNCDFQLDVVERLGLKYSKAEEGQEDIGEILVSKNQDNIDEFKRLHKEWDPEEDEYSFDLNFKLGKILGYTNSAIKEFDRSFKEFDPPKFWKDVIEGEEISDELILVLDVMEMTPANCRDEESIELGKKIKTLLDKIDPKLTENIIESRKKELLSEAHETFKHFHKD